MGNIIVVVCHVTVAPTGSNHAVNLYNFLLSSDEVKSCCCSLFCHGSDDMSLKGCQYKQVTGYSYLGTNNMSI